MMKELFYTLIWKLLHSFVYAMYALLVACCPRFKNISHKSFTISRILTKINKFVYELSKFCVIHT